MGKIYDALEKSKVKRTVSVAFDETPITAVDDRADETDNLKKPISLYSDVRVSDVKGKPRKAIESLRNRMIPIISSSGKAGYRLDTSPEAIQNMIRELKSRIAHMEQKIEAIQQHYGLRGEWLGENTA